MQGDGDIGKAFEIDVEKVARNAADDRLVANNEYRVLLPLNPIDEGFYASNGIYVGLAGGVPEMKLFDSSLFGDVRMLFEDLLVSHILTYSSIYLIQDPEFNRLFLVYLDILGSVYCPL